MVLSKWFILLTLLTMATPSMGNCQNRTIPGLTMVTLSIAMRTMNGNLISSMQCHQSMQVPLTKALSCVKLAEIKLTTGGCYCYRNIAGTSKLSRHAYGTAIDINPGKSMPQRVVECFESAGFEWGGRWPVPKTDPMHFQLRKGTPNDEPNNLYTPTLPSNLIPQGPR